MKIRKILVSVAGLALIVGTGAARSISANAASEYAIKGDAGVSFYAYMTTNSTFVPKMDLTYTITYLKGTSSLQPTGLPNTTETAATSSTATVSFTGEETLGTIASPDTVDTSVLKINTGSTSPKDDVTNNGMTKYAKEKVTLDFSNVTFKDVGDYDYLITPNSDASKKAIEYSSEPKIIRVMVRYAVDDNNNVINDSNGAPTFVSNAYVLYNTTATKGEDNKTAYSANTATKSFGFTNQYVTSKLALYGEVDGNQASWDEYFRYDLVITNLLPNTIYNASDTYFETKTSITAASPTAHDNLTAVPTDDNGKLTATYWLKQYQSVAFENIDRGASYTITDYKTTLDDEGYNKENKAPTYYIAEDISNTANVQLTSGTFTTVGGAGIIVLNEDKTLKYTETVDSTSTDYTGTWTQTDQTVVLSVNYKNSKTVTKVLYKVTNSSNSFTFTSNNQTSDISVLDNNYYNAVGTPVITGTPIVLDKDTYSISDASLDGGAIIVITNTKSGAIPTGIITKVAPYALALSVGAFGLIIFAKKRKKEEE